MGKPATSVYMSAETETVDYLHQGLALWLAAGYQAASNTIHGLSKCMRAAHTTLQAFWTVLVFHTLACSLDEETSTLSLSTPPLNQNRCPWKSQPMGEAKGTSQITLFIWDLPLSFPIRLISQFALIWPRIVYSPGTSGTPWLRGLISSLKAVCVFSQVYILAGTFS